MKERPIIFSAPMVRAIIDGRKSQTRRPVKLREFHPSSPSGCGWDWDFRDRAGRWNSYTTRQLVESRHNPHGVPGDRLWCKETIRRVGAGGIGCAVFAADGAPTAIDTWPWKRDVLTAIHTPRGASRITLEISDVRVQRLQEISENDARAEGVDRDTEPCDHTRLNCDEIGCMGPTHRSTFRELWDTINGKRAAWESNCWVWALTFRRVS